MRLLALIVLVVVLQFVEVRGVFADEKPNIVLVMADDQGWGQVGYNNHPFLKTPNLDAMAANGLRFNRFYAGGPVCSPTRATVLTGRAHERTGVKEHGYALHLQEKTIAQALKKAGYATGHFGKWHLDGLRGPGVPVLKDDPYHPGRFGFDEWLTVTNFFDRNPLLSRMGVFEEHKGDSSEVVIEAGLKFIEQQAKANKPSLTVIWYGSPHSPWEATLDDQKSFRGRLGNHYGEIIAMDRSIGTLRKRLRELKIEEKTLVWFNSDNGGLRKNFGENTVGGLRGGKGDLWEGGIRVPAIVEWPSRFKPRVTDIPACTMDIFPTVVDLLGLPRDSMLELVDGISLKPLFDGQMKKRQKPIYFQYKTGAAVIDNDWKIVTQVRGSKKYELYNLSKDEKEQWNLFDKSPFDVNANIAISMEKMLLELSNSVQRSQKGHDYPEGKVTKEGPHGRHWTGVEEYQPFLEEFKKRPEYSNWIKKKPHLPKKKTGKKNKAKKKSNL